MTLVAKIDGVTLPDGALLIGGAPNSEVPGGISGLLTAAWYGEAPSVGITLDDPAGDLDSVLSLGSLHTFTVDETACTGKERIWSGWLTANRISRGPYSSGVSRIWDIDIIDMNWAFNLMAFRASSAKRPAETDIVRVAFGRASQPMAFTPLADNGRFNVTDNPVAFDEADYVARFPIELFASVAGTAGKNFYAYYDHDEEELSIHYDLVGVGPSSTLSISNDIADTSSTCFYPFPDAELRQDGAWKVTGMLFNYKGAYAYGIRQATIDELSPSEFSPDEFQRDEVYSTDRVGKASTAQALINRMLAERAIDRDTISVSIRVPASQVNLIEAGDIINAKFTHLPGYEDGVDLPVIRRNVVPTPGRVDSYDIHLELSGAAKPTGPGGGDPGNFPPPPSECDIDNVVIVQDKYAGAVESPPSVYTATWDSTPTPGNLLVCAWMSHTNLLIAGDMPGWTNRGFAHVVAVGGQAKLATVFTKIAGDSEPLDNSITFGVLSGLNQQYALQEWAGVDSVDVVQTKEDEVGSGGMEIAITPTAGGIGVIHFTSAYDGPHHTVLYPDMVLDSERGASPPTWFVGHMLVDDASGSYLPGFTTTGFHKGAGVAMMLVCTGSETDTPCIDAGQPSPDDEPVTPAPDGVETTFLTRCPFADNTLHVYVDNTDQTGAITSYDGAAGEFTLGFAPTPTERITVFYLGR